MMNTYGGMQRQEMVFSRGDEGETECRKRGFQGDRKCIAGNCCLQIIFFILYSSSPLYKEKDNI